MIIQLPYPPGILNPNDRSHWAKKNRVARDYKKACAALLNRHKPLLKGKSRFVITAAPPDGRRRDIDNFIASTKAMLDVVSQFSGVDDRNFQIQWPKTFLEPVMGGAVLIEVKDS